MSVAQVRTFEALATAPGGYPKYQLIDGAGTVVTAWTNIGVAALTDSASAPTPTYRVLLSLDPSLWYTILWDVGGGAVTSETFSGGGGGAIAEDDLTAIADAVLLRDWTAIEADVPARCSLQAFRSQRNRFTVAGGILTVCEEDDATVAWTMDLSPLFTGSIVVQPS